MSTPDSACWSGLNVRRGVLQPSDTSTSTRPSSRSSGKSSHDAESLLLPDELDLIDALEDEQQQTFSPVWTSIGARPLHLIQTPRGAGAAPPTVIWATSESRSSELAWGHWPYYHAFSHCISVLTERDARAAYEIQSNSGDSVQARDSENGPPSPLPPVYECLVDGVQHLWLIVPRRSARKVNRLMQISEEQMRAAMAFYGRTPTAAGTNGTGSARGTDANVDDDVLVAADRNRDSQPEEGDDAGLHADPGVAAPVLVSCTYGNEVDAVAVAVLLLAQHVNIRPHHHHRHASSYRSARGGQSINGQAYLASRLIETDQGVSHVWKGLLEWQDVERVQTVLRSSVY
ncbi:hypothetical protein BC827DRAFT_1157158 [Russula dissimulans]|nr:hypothetical protein BC827DRAFT_1157158 [Russula dissimulans]